MFCHKFQPSQKFVYHVLQATIYHPVKSYSLFPIDVSYPIREVPTTGVRPKLTDLGKDRGLGVRERHNIFIQVRGKGLCQGEHNLMKVWGLV